MCNDEKPSLSTITFVCACAVTEILLAEGLEMVNEGVSVKDVAFAEDSET
jgi:hypothetical protein